MDKFHQICQNFLLSNFMLYSIAPGHHIVRVIFMLPILHNAFLDVPYVIQSHCSYSGDFTNIKIPPSGVGRENRSVIKMMGRKLRGELLPILSSCDTT